MKLDSKVNFTCDKWTLPNHKYILVVTIHWVDSDWKLREVVIAANVIVGDHRSINLDRHMLGIFEDHALNKKIFCLTADNSSSNEVLGTHMAEWRQLEILDVRQNLLGCMAHVVNFAAKAGIKALGDACPAAGIPFSIHQP